MKICVVLTHQPDGNTSRAVSAKGKTWDVGQTINIGVKSPSSEQLRLVKEVYSDISKYANLDFNFNTSMSNADIRWHFNPGISYSFVGTDALYRRDINLPTVNIGWGPDYGTMMHEAGHSVGLLHEHQNPSAGIRWNKDAVYAYFMGYPNYWDRETIDHNILNSLSPDRVNYSAFDGDSIMLYGFDASLTLDGKGTTFNDVLSAGDKSHFRSLYPGRREEGQGEYETKLVDLFNRMFDSTRRLDRLNETQLVMMGKAVGLDVSKERLKAETIIDIEKKIRG
jgi:hypothetical protein